MTRGTQGTTSLFKDTNPGGADGEPGDFGVVGGALLFSAYNPSVGSELWISDGTTPGTKLLKDINPGAAHSSFPAVMRSIGNRAFLKASTTAFTDTSSGPTATWPRRPARRPSGHSKTVSKKTATEKKIYVSVASLPRQGRDRHGHPQAGLHGRGSQDALRRQGVGADHQEAQRRHPHAAGLLLRQRQGEVLEVRRCSRSR